MLVLSRNPGERIHVGGDITITVVEVKGNRVRIGIDAPGTLAILRGELYDQGAVDCGDGPASPTPPTKAG